MADDKEQSQALKRALVAIRDMRAKIDALESGKREPIAIVGMACRFPGSSNTPDQFWQLLINGGDGIAETPRDRWDLDSFYSADPNAPGKMYVRHGGFIDDVVGFDAEFFGITPREVASMDPQQRLLLEVAWEALEHAGIAPRNLLGSSTGVYVGMASSDFGQLMLNERRIDQVDPYLGTGSAACVAAGRISYLLGLHGPSLAIDTACSSSLVAIDAAIRDLRGGRCDLALAGGVSLILSPLATIYMSKLRALSPTGHCRTFDADADGYARGEGCGVIALKRLSDAKAAGDRIIATILGSATNHDGRSSGLTVPNGGAQEALLRTALKDAGIAAKDVAFIEAHGTGTPLGDPIEMHALGAVFSEGRSKADPLLVGSVKSNIGHLEAAAGIASVIKIALALQHGSLPRNLFFDRPNPHIHWDDLPVSVVTQTSEWPRHNTQPIAGVSAFGFSGTNAHLLLQASESVSNAANADRPAHVVTLSARTREALHDKAAQLAGYIETHPQTALKDIAYTANTGRSHLSERAAIVARSADDARRSLASMRRNLDDANVVTGRAPDGGSRKLAFLFTGQGSQYAGMGRGLYDAEPSFRAVIDECDALLQTWGTGSLKSMAFSGSPADPAALIHQTRWTQPALFAIELALARMWMSWGIQPSAVMGHSIGEYVAACIAGVFDLSDGLRLVSERGRLMQELPAGGMMYSVRVSEQAAREVVARSRGHVAIAAVNGPESVVISGEAAAVQRAIAELPAPAREHAKGLATSHAFHSPLMSAMLEPFRAVLASVRFSAPRLRIISNLTGKTAGAEITTAAYWLKHIMEPVQFGPSIAALAERSVDTFLEIGPHPTLTQLGQPNLPQNTTASWFSSLRRGRDDWSEILRTLGRLYCWGVNIDWKQFDRADTGRLVDIPTYPFQRTSYPYQQIQPPHRTAPTGLTPASHASAHPLLQQWFRSATWPQQIFQSRIAAETPSFVADHRIHGRLIFPLSGYLEMILAAANDVVGTANIEINDLAVEAPLVLEEQSARTLQLDLNRNEDGSLGFEIHSAADETAAEPAWTRHVSGTVRALPEKTAVPEAKLSDALIASAATEDVDAFYAELRSGGIEYGPSFRTVQELRRGTNKAIGRLRSNAASNPYIIDPGQLDGAFQVLGASLQGDGIEDVFLPFGFKRLRVFGKINEDAWSHAQIREQANRSPETRTGDVSWFAADGRPLLEIEGFTLKRAPAGSLRAHGNSTSDLYEIAWELLEGAQSSPSIGNWIIVPDETGIAAKLAERLRASGAQVVIAQNDDLQNTLRGAKGYRGIAYLAALGAPTYTREDDILYLQQKTCGGLLSVAQALQKEFAGSAWPELWVVTHGAQAVDENSTVDPQQTPLWGLAASIAAERRGLRCVRMDLDPSSPDHVDALFNEIAFDSGEDQIAVRANKRFARRLVRSSAQDAPTSFNPEAAYLVTGALGGLGLRLIPWMVNHGARHLHLVSRSEPGAESRQMIRDCESSGASIRLIRADVSDRAAMEEALAKIEASGEALRGIIHAAGTLDDALIEQQTWQRFELVMTPKIKGAWILHELTARHNLNFFVLFSSAASVLGAPAQANYAAANAFLDGFAHYRRSMGLPALTINWGAWDEVGMAARLTETERRRLGDRGVALMSPAAALADLGRLIAASGQRVAISIRWPQFLHSLDQDVPPMLRRLSVVSHAKRAEPTAPKLEDLLRDNPASKHPQLLTEFVAAAVARIARLGSPQHIDHDTPLFALGIDSLMAVELKNELATASRRSLDSSLVYDHPSISALANYLHALLGDKSAAPQQADGRPPEIELRPEEMSEGQRGIWLIHQLAPQSCAYNVAFAFRVHGELTTSLLHTAFEQIFERHPILTAAFVDAEQRIGDKTTASRQAVSEVDCSSWPASEILAQAEVVSRRPFDLATQPPIRAVLLKKSSQDHVLVFAVHHVAFDAWSVAVLFRELKEALAAAIEQRTPELGPRPTQYPAFVQWQRNFLAGPGGARDREFWLQQLSRDIPALSLSKRPEHGNPLSNVGEHYALSFPPSLNSALRNLAAAEGTTLFPVLLSAYRLFLAMETGAEDLSVGVPVAGRTDPRFTSTIGFFINTLPIRIKLEEGASFRTLLHRTSAAMREALNHQEYPFVRMVQDLGIRRDPLRTPIFQTTFNLLSASNRADMAQLFKPDSNETSVEAGTLTFEQFPLAEQLGQFEFQVEIIDAGGALGGSIKYDRALYARAEIEMLAGRFLFLLQQVAADPTLPITFPQSLSPLAVGASDSADREQFEI